MASKKERIQELAAALSSALSSVQPEAHLDWKAMFGGAGFYVDGTMFAAWYGESIALKLPEDARAELLRVEGAVQAQSPQYVEVPPAWIDDTRALESWVARSAAYVKAPKPKKKRL